MLAKAAASFFVDTIFMVTGSSWAKENIDKVRERQSSIYRIKYLNWLWLYLSNQKYDKVLAVWSMK
jgi:hypothetical protein